MSEPDRAFEISCPLLTPEVGFIALDIRLRVQAAPDRAGQARASTIAHKRGESVAFDQVAREQRDVLGNWAYRAFSGAWTARPPASIQIDYAAARHADVEGSAGRSSWHLPYVVAVLHGLFARPDRSLLPGARLWAFGEMRGEGFVEVTQPELLDKARIVGEAGAPGARQYLIFHQGDSVWRAQREFLAFLAETGRLPEAMSRVTLLRFRDLETLRSLLDLDSFDAWDSDACARRAGAPPVAVPPAPIPRPPMPAVTRVEKAPEPVEQGRSKPPPRAWWPAALAGIGALGVGVAVVALARHPEALPPAPPSTATPPRPAGVAAAVVDTGQPPAAEPPPPAPAVTTSAPRRWGHLPKPDTSVRPEASVKPEVAKPAKDAGPEPSEAVREKEAKTNLGTALDTADHRRVQATPIE